MHEVYLSDRHLAERYEVSRSTIWRWVARGLLPAPVQISPGTTRWIQTEIDARDQARIASRDEAAA